MGRLQSQMIPTRFLCTMGHFIALIMVFYTKKNNLRASLVDNNSSSDYLNANSELLAALWLCIICFAIEWIGILMGVSIFITFVNAFDILAHFMGGVLVCWFIIETWHYQTMWYFFVFFNLLPASLEIISFIRVFCCRVIAY